MSENCCGACRHWTTDFQDDVDSAVGQCTRFPPTITGEVPLTWTPHEIARVTKFPVLSYVRCCGEWARDRDRIDRAKEPNAALGGEPKAKRPAGATGCASDEREEKC